MVVEQALRVAREIIISNPAGKTRKNIHCIKWQWFRQVSAIIQCKVARTLCTLSCLQMQKLPGPV